MRRDRERDEKWNKYFERHRSLSERLLRLEKSFVFLT